MASEVVRWVGSVVLGLSCGASLWLFFYVAPWMSEVPLVPLLVVGVAVGLGLAWSGLPLLPDPDWKPESARGQELLERLQAWAREQQRRERSPQRREAHNASAALGLGSLLLLVGIGMEIFHLGTFSSAPMGVARILCFGGTLACAFGAWAHGGVMGRVVAVLLVVFTAAIASLFFR